MASPDKMTVARRILQLSLFAFVAVVLLGVLSCAARPRLMVDLLMADDLLSRSDAVLVTYAAGRRGAVRAAEIYRTGLAPVVVVSDFNTGDTPGIFTAHLQDLYVEELRSLGVPDSAIVRTAGIPTSTEEEALALREVILAHGYRQVIAVGLSYRMRRTALSLRHAVEPAGVTVLASAVPAREFDPDRWWQTRQGLSAVFNETPRLLYYFVRGRF